MYMCHIIIFFTYFCSEAVIFFLLHFLKISLSFCLSLVPKKSSHWGWYTVSVFTKVEWLCLASSTAVATLRGVTVIP